jgi:hypothetical protein
MSLKRHLSLLAAVVMGSACGPQLETEAPSDVATGMTFEQFQGLVAYEPDSDIYIVNGDEPVYGMKNLQDFYERNVRDGQLIVNRVGGVDDKWTDAQKVNITYCVSSSSFGSRYSTVVSAMAAAAAEWEKVGNVNFVHASQFDSNCTASQTGVVFDVRQTTTTSYLARAFFPSTGRSQRNVLISTSAFSGTGVWTLKGILVHELGHTLGFRHEHTRPEAGTCFENTSWRALTPYDSASVMHYPQCNGSNQGDLVITALDAQGTVALYGAPGSQPPPTGGTPTTETRSGSVASGAFVQVGSFAAVGGTTFKVTMTGSGDPDLYVRFGAAPTTTAYNCRPYLSGASETCTLTVPSGGSTAYVGVRGYTSGTYSLSISYTKP